jgi:hypothetical protein
VAAYVATSQLTPPKRTEAEEYNKAKSTVVKNDIDINRPKLLFIGTGSSTGCPKPICSMLFSPIESKMELTEELKKLREEYKDRCKTSSLASLGTTFAITVFQQTRVKTIYRQTLACR